MKIAFFCIPAHGHTNPTLGVVKELIARGHEVWYYSYESLREKIESTGAVFIPCDAYDTEQKLTPQDGARIGKDIAFSTKVLVDTTLALDEMVCHAMEEWKPDCIVADSMAFWGKMVAWKLGIPFVCSTTTFAFNQYSSKVMKQSIGELFKMMFYMPKVGKEIRRLKEHGYPVKNVLDIIGSDNETDTVVYTSPEFQPFSETFSEKYAFVGPSIRPVQKPFKKEKETLIYISMGTVNNDLVPLYRNVIQALAGTVYQVVLAVGEMVDLKQLGELPENITAAAYVDQMAVLEKADVFLSHCGMNSASESMYFGVPLLMLPQTTEQNGVASRVEELGAGIFLKDTSLSGIHAAVEQILQTPAYRINAEKIADSFKKCSGAKGAADKILEVCKK